MSLPVMVGYNGSQSSDTYSVAHQMNFLTQKVFSPAGRSTKQQYLQHVKRDQSLKLILFMDEYNWKRPVCHQLYLPFGSSPTTEVRNTRRPTPVKASVTLVENQTGMLHIIILKTALMLKHRKTHKRPIQCFMTTKFKLNTVI